MMTEPVKTSLPNSVSLGSVSPAVGSDAVARGVDRGGEQGKPDPREIEAAISGLKQSFELIHQVDLQFSVHEASGRTVVTVKDALTGEVIREIPPSELLNLAARLDEMIGLLFDQVG
ncbi:MAG: flagellar protein FlaG [Desulfobacterota bacterium]|jgi:flagellar protein FlaG|nr:flagellar protein FlaG [Thermodesulfobacteriota bacterium]